MKILYFICSPKKKEKKTGYIFMPFLYMYFFLVTIIYGYVLMVLLDDMPKQIDQGLYVDDEMLFDIIYNIFSSTYPN